MAKLIVNGEEKSFDASADMASLWVVRDILGMARTKLHWRVTRRDARAVHLDGSSIDSRKLPGGAMTIANPSSHHYLASQRSLAGRLGDFIALMKPRVMMLAVFTALVGMAGASRELDPLHAFVAALAIAAGAGAAGVLNMWYDADIDAIMTRTAMRPIPRGKVSQLEALILGLE